MFPLAVIVALLVTLIACWLLLRKKKIEIKYKYNKEDIEFVNINKPFTSKINDRCDIRYTKKGIGSLKETPPMTIFELFDKGIGKNNKSDANLLGKEYINNNDEYEWKYMTRKQVYDSVLSASRGFIHYGLNQFESVCIMGFNSPQWFIANLAAIYCGGISVGLYSTNNTGQCQYIINNCNAKIIVLENGKLLNKFMNCDNLGNVTTIIIWNDDEAVNNNNNNDNIKFNVNIISWNDFINNKDLDINKYNDIIKKRQLCIKPNNCASLIYTSGTTGPPKGVMLSHDNLIFTILSIFASQKNVKFWGNQCKIKQHSIVSYLPLSHIAAQCLDIYGPLIIAYNDGDGCIYFARNDALKGSLITTLKFVQPTVFLGVPRVWEKIEEKMRLIGKKGNFIVRNISKLSKKIGLKYALNKEIGSKSRDIPLLFNLINYTIFKTIKLKLGFNRLQLAITGAAPIKEITIKYFHSLNINLIEGYGMSETNGLIAMGLSYHNKIGSVGPPLLGINIIINKNEICVNGRNIMMGYLNNENKTKDVFLKYNNNYYLKTGDIGKIDKDYNLLFITGRLKELIITAGGENIAPIPIEDHIKSILNDGINNCILIGDKRKYLTILITLKTINEDSLILDKNASQIDPNCTKISDAQKSKIWDNYIKSGIKNYNENTEKCVSRAQRIQYYRILDKDFSILSGEMTSTLKLKRSVIAHKYKSVIDSMY